MVRAADVEGVTVQYKVKGFTCVTCAVGLEVMLHRRPGVLRVRASYPDASVQICFNPDAVSEPALKEFIVAQGFSVESSQPSS
jgi:Cu+-exporting ATPase